MKNNLEILKKWSLDSSKGEVSTPNRLVRRMLDKIPERIWRNPKSTFCDLSMGRGTFLVEIVNRLVYIYGYSQEDAISRVYGYEIRVKYVNLMRRMGFVNIFHKDSLEEEFNMKFDVVIGNPPYQEVTGAANSKGIWSNFVKKSFEICEEGGYVSLIHPSGWRDVKGNFSHIKDLLKSKNIKYLNVNDFNTGKEVFGVGTNFDWYVVENSENENSETNINTISDVDDLSNLNSMEFIPGGLFNIYEGLGPKEGEETVDLISNSSYHHQRNHVNKVITCEYIYPCVYSITQKNGVNFHYSNVNDKGHFGISKLIFSDGLGTYPILDVMGEYGMTQFGHAIVDVPENLPLIKKVIESSVFIELMGYVKFTNNKYNRKVISTFRKDFWKDFLDENGEVITDINGIGKTVKQ